MDKFPQIVVIIGENIDIQFRHYHVPILHIARFVGIMGHSGGREYERLVELDGGIVILRHFAETFKVK